LHNLKIIATIFLLNNLNTLFIPFCMLRHPSVAHLGTILLNTK